MQPTGIENPIILHFISSKKPWVYWKPVDTNDFEFNYTKPNGGITLDNMGSVTLVQKNMSRANTFNVRINFKVTYSWGTLYYPITVKVNAAPGNTVSLR